MNKKISEQFYIVYDKKRKGFVFDFDVYKKQRHGITKNFQNAKCFDNLEAVKKAVQKFCDKTKEYDKEWREWQENNKDIWSINPILVYQDDDFDILICEKTIEIKSYSSISTMPSWRKNNP